MGFDGDEDGFEAGWFSYEKPVFVELIIDAEFMALKREVDPGFCNTVANEVRKDSPGQ